MNILSESWNHGKLHTYLPAERMNCTGDILGIYLFNIFEMKFPLEINLFTICVSTLNNWLQWQICVLFKFFPSHSGLMLRSSLWLLLIFIFKRGRNIKKEKSACFFCCEMWHKEPILYSNPIPLHAYTFFACPSYDFLDEICLTVLVQLSI